MQVQVDYYAILGLPKSAGTDELREAHRVLAQRFHPQDNPAPEADKKFEAVQEAFRILGDRTQRTKYLRARAMQGFDHPVALNLYPVASHNLLRSTSDPQAYYALLKISPAANLPRKRLPLNLCLVLDRSTSMQGARLQQVKEAVGHIIDRLQPTDSFSLVTFSDRAEVLLPGQPGFDKTHAKAIVSTIQPGGGTEILRGLSLGLEQIVQHREKTAISHLILLTDGRTYGDEQTCLERAKRAGTQQINITTMGIGTDWNEDLLNQMATYSGGMPVYIDSPHKIPDAFSEVMHNLDRTAALDLNLNFKLHANVQLHEAHQITPYIRPLTVEQSKVRLGSLAAQSARLVLLEFRVQNLPLGKQRLVHIKIDAHMPQQTEWRTWETADLNAHVDSQTLSGSNIPKTVANVLEKLSVYKMQQKLFADLAISDFDTASRRLKVLATRLLNVGAGELAQIAIQEIGNLAKTGQLSAKGQKQLRYGTLTLATRQKMAVPAPRQHVSKRQDTMLISKPDKPR